MLVTHGHHILSLGIDLCSIERFDRCFGDSRSERQWHKTLQRLFTPTELQEIKQVPTALLAEKLASRFAAKEAAIKSISPILGRTVFFGELETFRQRSSHEKSQLAIKLTDEKLNSQYGFLLSIAHERQQVIAIAALFAHEATVST